MIAFEHLIIGFVYQKLNYQPDTFLVYAYLSPLLTLRNCHG